MKKIILHADDYGRSPNISKSIYQCIKAKTINSISIIVSEKIYGLNYLKKIKVKKRLHLNLTDFSQKLSKKSFLYDLSFIDLLLLPLFPRYNQKKKIIEKEIDRQIKIYQKISKEKKIFLDGHQHIHMIPWIFDLIYQKRVKFNISSMRIPDEKFIINIEDIIKLSILKNIIKFFIIKILIFFSSHKIKKINYDYKFFGIIYSGYQNIKYIHKLLNLKSNKKLKNKIEILLHPGFASKSEKNLFKKSFFEYYSSVKRIKEFNLTLSLKKFL